jgi:hypothetical protein
MLTLAGMITLSIIGAIAAIPSGSLPQNIRFEADRWPAPEAREAPRPVPQAQSRPPSEERARPGAEARGQAVAVAPAPPKPVEPADWLEAITYALLALAGIAALGVLLLWRALIQWRRSADALEAIAARRG